jgi:hypothetical protein
VNVSLRSLFESPTVAGWASVIERSEFEETDVGIPGIQKMARGEKSFDELLAELNQLSESEVKAMLASHT